MLSKGTESAIRTLLLEKSSGIGNGSSPSHYQVFAGVIQALFIAVTSRGQWPTGIPYVHVTVTPARLSNQVAKFPTSRLAWLAAGLLAITSKCRNGYIHAHAARRRAADEFRQLLLAPDGFVSFLVTPATEVPSDDVQTRIRALLSQRNPIATSGFAWLSPTEAKWVNEDALQYGREYDAHNPVPQDLDELEQAAKRGDIAIGAYDYAHNVNATIASLADPGDNDRAMYAVRKFEPWPRVKMRVFMVLQNNVRQDAIDLRDFRPSLSTLRWRLPSDRLIVEWCATDGRAVESMELVPTAAPPPLDSDLESEWQSPSGSPIDGSGGAKPVDNGDLTPLNDQPPSGLPRPGPWTDERIAT